MQLDRKQIAREIVKEGTEVDLIEAYRALNIVMVGYRFGHTNRERSSAIISPVGTEIVRRIEAASPEELKGKTWLDFAQDIPECNGMKPDTQEQAYFDAFQRLLAEFQHSKVTISGSPSAKELERIMRGENTQTTELQNAIRGNMRVILGEAVRSKFAREFRLGTTRFHSSETGLSQIKHEINPTILALEKLLATVGST